MAKKRSDKIALALSAVAGEDSVRISKEVRDAYKLTDEQYMLFMAVWYMQASFAFQNISQDELNEYVDKHTDVFGHKIVKNVKAMYNGGDMEKWFESAPRDCRIVYLAQYLLNKELETQGIIQWSV